MSENGSGTSDDSPMSALPVNWAQALLGEISEISPRFDSDNTDDNMEVTFLPMKAVEKMTGRFDGSATRRLGEVRKGYTFFKNGDLLFAKITPCMENGKVVVVESLRNGIGFGSTEFHVIRLHESLPRKFFFFFLIREDLRKDAQRSMTGTAGQLRVPPSYMQQIRVPLPPIAEQYRIVSRIEELFTKLDAGVRSLETVEAQLKRYRQSVLKSAFEGKLTEEWRRTHRDELEPASKLLERIKDERRKNVMGRYKEYPRIDTTSLPELPKGWIWTRMGEVIRIIDYRGRTPPFSSEGIPHLRSSNIRQGRILWDNLEYVSEETYSEYMTRGLPEKGDLLFTTEAPLGEVAFVPDQRFSVAQRMMILRPLKDVLDPKFLLYQIMSDRFQARLRGRGTGTTVTGVSSRNFRPLELAICSIAEQRKVAEDVDRHLSVIDNVESVIPINLRHAENLRRSILRRAFEGKLTRQDPSDEPASVLLERIRSSKMQGVCYQETKRKSRNDPKQPRLM